MTVKFVGDDNVWGPVHPSISPATEYIDLWPLNVYPLVEIEWVEFPRTVVTKRPNNVPAKLEPQDIDTIRTVLVGTGKQFPLEVSYDAIRVLGHTK